MNYDEIEHRFVYHPPTGEGQIQRYRAIREMAKDLAHTIDALVEDSREKSVALTKLDEVVFWANAGVAREKEV